MPNLLKQNSELRADRIWNWTLPAWVTKMPDGTNINVCPSAGACAKVCYARNGTYNFKGVKAAHTRNLSMVRDDLNKWGELMKQELRHKKFSPSGVARFDEEQLAALALNARDAIWAEVGGAAVRIHDAGDFFSAEYLLKWLEIAEEFPLIVFYAYTKEVLKFRELVERKAPANFKWVYSMGGKHDSIINLDTERHADVFPTMEMLLERGYTPQTESDLYAVLLPTTRIGVPANNIPAFKKIMQGKSFSEIQKNRKTHD